MTLENRKFIIGTAVGLLLFFGVYHFFLNKPATEKKEEKNVSPDDIDTAVRAYKAAYEKGEDTATMIELNKQLKKELGCTVSFDQGVKKYMVKDVDGRVIKSMT